MDTDYNDYALLCTCQSAGLVITTLHRRSCTILGREPVRNPDVRDMFMDIISTLKNGKLICQIGN